MPNAAELSERQKARLVGRTIDQIQERALSRPTGFHNLENSKRVTDHVKKPEMWVVHAEYKAKDYNGWNWVSRPVRVSYLCGHEDGQDWAARVPGTITTVEKAMEWLTPAAVRKAVAKGLPVKRQGDMYFIPMRIKKNDFTAIERTSHRFYGTIAISEEGKTYIGEARIVHPQHPEVKLSDAYRWRAVQQTQLGGDGYRTGGD